jgi:hypothetical protein
MSYVNVAMAGASLISGMGSASAARKQGEAQAVLADSSAKIEESNALELAKVIRKAGRKQVAATTAGYAAAGVKVGEGSAADVQNEQIVDIEHDAFQAILEGKRRAISMRAEGRMGQIVGRARGAGEIASAMGSAIGYGYQGMKGSGWRTAGPGFSGTQQPAPIETRTIPGG